MALVALVWAGVLALAGAPSIAATGHKFLSQLKEAPPGSVLRGPEGVTVDKAGDVFVADGEHIDVFSSSGTFKTQFGAGFLEGELAGLAVDAGGRVYVADPQGNKLVVFKPDGKGGYEHLSNWTGANVLPEKAFGEVDGVAVNTSTGNPSSGDVYVVDKAGNAVDVFKPEEGAGEANEGKFLSALKGKPKLEEPDSVAVDSGTGKVYVAEPVEPGIVEVFNSSGLFESKITGKVTPTKVILHAAAVAVEESTHDVYVADSEGRVVDQFGEKGEWIGWITTAGGAAPGEPFGEPHDVAIAPSGHVYVADKPELVVDEFGPNLVVPDAATNAATKVERQGATLNGSINTLGKPTKYHFDYREAGEETFKETSPATAMEGVSKVKTVVTGLKPEAFYEFRLVAENAEGPSLGATLEFSTPPAVTGVTTGAASSVEPTTATLNGSLEPEGRETSYHFEYGTTTSYGHSTPEATTSGTGVVPVTAPLTGLTPNTVYHFRLVAKNTFGTTLGNDAQFKTSGPPAIISKPTEPIANTSATLHAEVNPGKLATKYRFEYGETTAYGTNVPVPDGEIPAGGEAAVPISAGLTSLKLATVYHFRVVATNAAGTTNGPDEEFTTGPISGVSAKEVGSETATLQAEINPLGHDTKYHFEYGETTSYGKSIPEPDGDLGSVAGNQIVDAALSGLHPGTTYHFRVVAVVEGEGTGVGQDHTFTTSTTGGVAFTLPDHRAYEMVSPPNKHGAFIEPQTAVGGAIQSSQDGNSFAYVVIGAVNENAEGNRSPDVQQVLANRGNNEWESRELVTPHERGFGLRPNTLQEYIMFSPDLSVSIVHPFPFGLTPLAEPPLAPPLTEAERKPCPESSDPRPCQEKTMYARNDAPLSPGAAESKVFKEAEHNGQVIAQERGESEAKPGYLPLVTAGNTAPGVKFGGRVFENEPLVVPSLEFQSATPDLSHVVLFSSVALGSAPSPPGLPGLYEWHENKLTLVSVLPSGEPAGEAADLGVGARNTGPNFRHAISNDGTRVIWTKPEAGGGLGHLYMRHTKNPEKEETLQLDALESGLPGETGAARFQIASADGSRVFFTDVHQLTEDSRAGPGREDLYECNVTEEPSGKLHCALTDITAKQPPGGESAGVRGAVLGASEDGSYIYFVATGKLAEGGQSGAFNLYGMHREGASWTTSFIAGLSAEDGPDWLNNLLGEANLYHLSNLTARVSPNGLHLAFMSNQRLTGYDNTDVYEEEVGGTRVKHADEEVFLWSVGAPRPLTCASCNPSGARPRGVFDQSASGEGTGLVVDKPAAWGAQSQPKVAHWLAGSIPGWTAISSGNALYQSSYLSDEGRLFFNSADPLVSAAAGHTRVEEISGKKVQVGVENVYQYEPSGVGSCTSGSGCVSLISRGTSEKESAFLDASPNGDNVFFLTAERLLPQDTDTSFDIYDARVCTEGSPCLPPSSPPGAPCGSTEQCRPGGSSLPGFQSPSSSTFTGPGNGSSVASGGTLPSKTTKPTPLTRAQKLALALRLCRKLPHKTHAQKSKRRRCETQARKKYGPKKANHSKRKHK